MSADAWRKSPEELVARFADAVAVPDEVIADPEEARAWVERAVEYVRGLPPKKPKAPKKR